MTHPKKHAWPILFVCSLCAFMISMDYSVVQLAASSIQHALNIATSTLQWLMTAFGIALGAFVAIGGRFADG